MPKWLLLGLAAAAVVLSLAIVIFLALKEKRAPERRTEAEARREVNTPSPVPPTPVEVRQTSDESGPPSPEDIPGYLVIGLSSRARVEAEAEAERRRLEGHRTHVRPSGDWSGLVPGWYVVVYDSFDNAAAAKRAAAALRSRGVDAYAKYSGRAKTGGEASAPDREAAAVARVTYPPAAPDMKGAEKRYDAEEREALGAVRELWDRHFTKCGDSYVTFDSHNVMRQLMGVSFLVTRLTYVLRAPARQAGPETGAEVEWSGTVQAKWDVWREADGRGREWAWGKWRESPQSRTFEVRKVNSEWQVLNEMEGLKKVGCSEAAP